MPATTDYFCYSRCDNNHNTKRA